MTWGDLRVLYLLSIVPLLVVAYALDGQRRRRLLEHIGHLPMIARMTASFSPARRRWRAVLQVSGIAFVIVALARPQIPGRAKLTESRGLDLVVALDFSKSMLARDVYPTRLERAKAELARFIDTLHGDRVGLVAFAGETMSYPLTVDYEAAKGPIRAALASGNSVDEAAIANRLVGALRSQYRAVAELARTGDRR